MLSVLTRALRRWIARHLMREASREVSSVRWNGEKWERVDRRLRLSEEMQRRGVYDQPEING